MKKVVILFVMIIILCLFFVTPSNKSKSSFKPKKNWSETSFGDSITYLYQSSRVNFNNTSSGLKSRTVQNAIDELYNAIEDGCYVGYTKSIVSNNLYICNKESSDSASVTDIDALDVKYDNTNSGLTSENVSDAIDELSSMINYCLPSYAKQNETSTSYECNLSQFNCAAGTYLLANAMECSNCPAGKYCEGGTFVFNATTSQGIDGDCNANTYSTGGAVDATCTSCGSGKSSLVGSISADACFDTVKTYSQKSCTSNSSSGNSVSAQTFVVPETGSYLLEAYGAQGGKGSGSSTYGGKGGYSKGTITLTKGDTLYVYVGCRGNTPWGGNNGGGSGTQEAGATAGKGGGGGGATHIATVGRGVLKNYSSHKTELLLVAGGGGGGSESGNRAGGSGGGTSGGAGGGGLYPGKGGTQTTYGARGDSDCTNAGFGYGGNSAYGNSAADTFGSGGGGGGYYGGGAASHSSANGEASSSGGGGGSGYVSSQLTSASTTAGKRTGHGQVIITWKG